MKSVSTDEIDGLSIDKIKKIQLKLIKEQLEYVLKKSKFYRKKFKEAGISYDKIKKIKSLKEIECIPFTTKNELRTFNDDFFCVPNKKIVDIGATTGTTGSPIILPATKNDIKRLVSTYKRSFYSIGITNNDIVQLSVAFDQLFPIGVTANATLKEIGATVVRMGPGNTKRQIEIMRRLRSTVIFASPDYMLTLAEAAKEMGFDPAKDFFLEKGLFHGHPLFDRECKPTLLADKINEIWGIECFSCYGSMEMYSGMFDCRFHCGYHTHPDWLYLEIIDPKTGEVLEDGMEGEIVVTTLRREAVPLIRFRQGDITSIISEPCKCGKTSPRITAIAGRADHQMRLKGTLVYPQQIEEILIREPEITEYALEAYKDENDCDALKIMVCLKEGYESALERIKTNLKARIRITPEMEILSSNEISKIIYRHGSRKPSKFIDRRAYLA